MKTNYEQLREIRNEKFPPVLELGCEVEFDVTKMKPQEALDIVNQFKLQKIGIINTVDNKRPRAIFPSGNDCDVSSFEHIIKILGKPLSLRDVLLMCFNVKLSMALYEDGSYQIIDPSQVDDVNGVFLEDKLDLKNPLSEQDEACGKIVKLLKD